MQLRTRVRRGVAVALMMGLIGIGTTACFPVTSASPPADPYLAAVYNAMNYQRALNGVPGLVHSPKLTNLAGSWSWQMAQDGWLRHQNLSAILYSPDFAAFYTLAENIIVAPGHYSANQLVASWMASAPHRANILSRSFNVVGVGMVRGPDGRIWATVNFGGV
jgi:uncharacterized protein YkwD